ncbi:hypothetical protein BSM4216_0876 [Bacillus smithii]|nr:hypothetical protein BSM4216_0876 [Bacillus smithii]
MMPMVGVEPTLLQGNTILSRALVAIHQQYWANNVCHKFLSENLKKLV